MTEAVLVIGAGPAGLAAAAELGRRGVHAEIIEKSNTIAPAWRSRYDQLRLNTVRWDSTLSGERFPRGTPVFPLRDEFVRYLEGYAERHEIRVRFGTEAHRIDPGHDGWRASTSAGTLTASHVIVATGYAHTPVRPAWPGLAQYRGRLLHSAGYRSAAPFAGADVLVAGAGSSGLDIAYDLVQGGAARVRVAVRSAPYLLLRMSGPVPTYVLARTLARIPARLADSVIGVVRRWTVGDLSHWGLTEPAEGMFARMARTGRAPSVVDPPVIEAIKTGKIEIVARVATVGANEVLLADGTALRPDAVIAATGFSPGLEPVVGHLGVLNDRGLPRAFGGPAVLPGLRFTGYIPNIGNLRHDARAVAEQVSRELAGTAPVRAARPGRSLSRAAG